MISLRPRGSRPAVGSSRPILPAPWQVHQQWPPVAFVRRISQMETFQEFPHANPTCAMAFLASFFASISETPKFIGPKHISFSTVSSNN